MIIKHNDDYTFKKSTVKDFIYKYWNHTSSGLPVCTIIDKYIDKSKDFNFIEIGCGLGGLSDLILNEFDNSTVYSLDIYVQSPDRFAQLEKEFGKRFTFILGSSLVVYKEFDDNFFDCIYIDSSTPVNTHEYGQEEIDIWFPKVKTGGLVCFHDYDHPSFPGVKLCVDEYCNNNNLDLNVYSYYNAFFVKK